MRTVLPFICALLMSGAANAQQQREMDITHVMSLFVTAQVAADKCLKPTKEEKEQFAQNLLLVTIKTKQAIQERSPGTPDAKLEAEFNYFYSKVRKSYAKALAKAGCQSELGKEGAALWKANAKRTQ